MQERCKLHWAKFSLANKVQHGQQMIIILASQSGSSASFASQASELTRLTQLEQVARSVVLSQAGQTQIKLRDELRRLVKLWPV